MTGWERITRYLEDVWGMIKPTDLTSTISFVVLVAIFVIAIIGRKQFGGFWKALFKMFGALLFAFILNAISPWLLWSVIAFGVLAYVFRNHMKYFYTGIMVVTIVATVIFLFVRIWA